MKKRILMVINSPLINSGVPNVVMEIVRNLKDNYIFDVLTYSANEGVYDKEFLTYGGKIYKIDLIDYYKHKLLYPCRYFQLYKKLKVILSANNYNAIHCHNGIESGVCMKLAYKYKIPIRISHAHGNYFRNGKNIVLLNYHSFCKKLICNYSTVRITCSSQAGKSLFGNEDYINILNPVNVIFFKSIERQYHLGIELLQIGYFNSNKNQIHSLKVLDLMRKEGINAKLNFIGFEHENGYLNKMKEYIVDAGLSDSVCFWAPDIDKSKLFGKIDCILMPSHSEGLPIAALEGQVSGIPCILSKNISEDVDIGNSYFIKLNEFDDWVEKIKNVCLRKNEQSKVDYNSVDIDKYIEKISNLYETVV